METYIFFRAAPAEWDDDEMFYPVELRDDDDARKGAEINPGTLRVETVAGRVVWSPPEG